jgi:ParB family chromosome partitioning protein
MTTATAGNVAGQPEKDKEKVEKRRALGRGLASLLPGPRVLNPFAKNAPTPGTGVSAAETKNVAAAPTSGPVGDGTNSIDAIPSAIEQRVGGDAHPEHFPESQNPQPVAESATRLGHPVIVAGAAVPIPGDGAGQADTRADAPAPHSTDSIDYDPFGDAPADGVIEIQAVADTRVPSNLVVNLAISDIDKNPFQTRHIEDDEALEELADSIKANGVVQPIVVRPAEESGRYILILGERRLHASKKVGKTHIPALVRRVSEQQAAEMTIVENLQREDLSPLEQAEAFRVLSNKFSLTQQEIAERVGLSRTSITNYMRLLKLPREVMQMLAEKRLNFAQAKELLKLGDNDRIAEAALYAVKKGMNIDQIESLVLRMEGLLDPLPDMPGLQKEKKSSGARWVDPNVRAAQLDLERMLGVRVRIRDRKGRGKIVIEYSTVDDYERVVEMLRGKK